MRKTKYTVKYTTAFKKDYKRAIKRGLKIELLEQVVALLEQLPLLWLHPGKLLVDSLVPVVLRPHLSALSEDSDPALGLNDFSPQVIVAGVHICDFFMELLALRLLCLGLRPVVEAGNAGLDFLEQLVVGDDL
ncbi:hypothetical protein [Hornefia butyriciproducens]|uniref:hypothetical protein n=1 Tax=Hornefia butyriciproducens TaxID=2652293 RepID=UPI003F8B0D3A